METSSQPFCIHSWGANSYGQLGQGHVEDQARPRLSDAAALQQHKAGLRALSGGGGHSVAVTEDGEVFVCGQNHRGQLGLGHNADISTLQLCPSLSQKVKKVACGWDFTLLLTDCGRVLACGSNAFGQLGVGQTVTHSADPLVVESLKEPAGEPSSRTQTFTSCY
ncbi:Secretion-regulating guanine nucleotide exchange factor, partial [Larimichthys crocea]